MSKPKRLLLLIDDNEIDRSCLSFALTIAGYRVLTARGSESLDHFWKTAPELVIVKAEPEFPDVMDGYKLTAAFKRLSPYTPVLLFSHQVRHWYGVEHTADRFFPKGWSTQELLESIRVALIRKRGPKAKPVQSALQVHGMEARA